MGTWPLRVGTRPLRTHAHSPFPPRFNIRIHTRGFKICALFGTRARALSFCVLWRVQASAAVCWTEVAYGTRTSTKPPPTRTVHKERTAHRETRSRIVDASFWEVRTTKQSKVAKVPRLKTTCLRLCVVPLRGLTRLARSFSLRLRGPGCFLLLAERGALLVGGSAAAPFPPQGLHDWYTSLRRAVEAMQARAAVTAGSESAL